jgi:hypothetical protein
MSYGERPTVAVILSIIGGAFMLVGGSMAFMMLTYRNGGFGMMDRFGGMMGDYGNVTDRLSFPYSIMTLVMFVSLVSGILVIVGAVMIDIHPSQSRT